MRKNGAGASLIRVIAPVVFLCSSGVSSAASLVVTTTADSGPGSLRSAISQADATSDAAISFSIPSSAASATGVVTISPVSALPILTGAGTVIDGTTQQIPAGTARNGQAVVINGSNAGVSSGLVVEAAHCLIKGLAISGFSAAGIELSGSSANNDTVQFCYLGTDPTGISAAPNGEWGIGVYDGAHNNVIGGNIISGNTQDGVLITDTSTSQNIFVSNLIGVDATGRKALPNGGAGVVFDNSATSNTIGVVSLRHAASATFKREFAVLEHLVAFEPAKMCCAVRARWEIKPVVRAFIAAVQADAPAHIDPRRLQAALAL